MNISEYQFMDISFWIINGYQFFIFKIFYQLKDIHSRLFTLSLTFFLSFDRFCHFFLINHYFLHKKCKKIDKKCRNFQKKSSTKTVIPLTVNKVALSGVFVPLKPSFPLKRSLTVLKKLLSSTFDVYHSLNFVVSVWVLSQAGVGALVVRLDNLVGKD